MRKINPGDFSVLHVLRYIMLTIKFLHVFPTQCGQMTEQKIHADTSIVTRAPGEALVYDSVIVVLDEIDL